MTSSLVSFAAASEVPELEENHLFMPAWGYGLVAIILFIALLGLLWSFRNTAARFGAPRAHGQNQGTKH